VFLTPSGEPQRPSADARAAAFGFTPSEVRILDLPRAGGGTLLLAGDSRGDASTILPDQLAS
jgi:hypothetical protein